MHAGIDQFSGQGLDAGPGERKLEIGFGREPLRLGQARHGFAEAGLHFHLVDCTRAIQIQIAKRHALFGRLAFDLERFQLLHRVEHGLLQIIFGFMQLGFARGLFAGGACHRGIHLAALIERDTQTEAGAETTARLQVALVVRGLDFGIECRPRTRALGRKHGTRGLGILAQRRHHRVRLTRVLEQRLVVGNVALKPGERRRHQFTGNIARPIERQRQLQPHRELAFLALGAHDQRFLIAVFGFQ